MFRPWGIPTVPAKNLWLIARRAYAIPVPRIRIVVCNTKGRSRQTAEIMENENRLSGLAVSYSEKSGKEPVRKQPGKMTIPSLPACWTPLESSVENLERSLNFVICKRRRGHRKTDLFGRKFCLFIRDLARNPGRWLSSITGKFLVTRHDNTV